MEQGVRDLSWLQLWHRSKLWPRNFHMPQVCPTHTPKKNLSGFLCLRQVTPLSLVLFHILLGPGVRRP